MSDGDVLITPVHPGEAEVHPFFVQAKLSLSEQNVRVLKHGDTFAVFDANGDVEVLPGGAEGIYHRDTRHLSFYLLTLGGQRPLLLGSTLGDDNAVLTCDLTNPDVTEGDRVVLDHDLVHVRRSRFLWEAACIERLALHNFSGAPQRVSLRLAFGADFADLFEVRGQRRPARGRVLPAHVGASRVTLAYEGLDGLERRTQLTFDPAPSDIGSDFAVFELPLAPNEQAAVFIEMRFDAASTTVSPRVAFSKGVRASRQALRSAAKRGAAIAGSHEIFNEGIRRAVADLRMLVTDTPEGPYPYAGIPWFSAVFGRDALITAMQTLWFDPRIAQGVLQHLAANQATEEIPEADAEPGKILHEVRHGEMAQLGEVPFRRYYGSVDSTPLFVMLAGMYAERTDDFEAIRALWPHLRAALSWIDTYGDADGDGFVEYGRRSREGLVNQGWKDSHDSVFHRDGTMAEGPIALAEVQGYVYAAWRYAAAIAERLGLSGEAADLAGRAERLRQRFADRFFDSELGTFVIALDGRKQPCRVRTSNAGHVLFAGLAMPDHAGRVVDTLMQNSSYSGWGIRTVASTEPRYNPMSYHNGSIWPHDNAMIAAGFARYGYRQQAARIFEGLFAASFHMELRRLPELFCGFSRQRNQAPTLYPVACTPQAWAATAPLSMLASCLGLGFDSPARTILFDRPALPAFLDTVSLLGVSVGGSRADLTLSRVNGEVAVHVQKRQGDVVVVTTN